MRVLVVPSSSLSPLSTDVPVPTDGQPGWWRCGRCGMRGVPSILGIRPPYCPNFHGLPVPDGPYPFTVAVRQEVDRCSWKNSVVDGAHSCSPSARHETVGAVVALVEVTGPGHHADKCGVHACPRDGIGDCFTDYCTPDALADCWHTPTGKVTMLDVPIPMERAAWCFDCQGPCEVGVDHLTDWEPASSWWADLTVEANA